MVGPHEVLALVHRHQAHRGGRDGARGVGGHRVVVVRVEVVEEVVVVEGGWVVEGDAAGDGGGEADAAPAAAVARGLEDGGEGRPGRRRLLLCLEGELQALGRATDGEGALGYGLHVVAVHLEIGDGIDPAEFDRRYVVRLGRFLLRRCHKYK